MHTYWKKFSLNKLHQFLLLLNRFPSRHASFSLKIVPYLCYLTPLTSSKYVIFKNMYAYCIFKTTWKLWLNLSFSDKTSKLLLNFITFKIQYCRWDFLMPKILWVEPLKGNNWKWSLKLKLLGLKFLVD